MHAPLPAFRPAGATIPFGLPAATTSLDPAGPPLVTLEHPSTVLKPPRLEKPSAGKLGRESGIRLVPRATSVSLATQVAAWAARIHWGDTQGDGKGDGYHEPGPDETLAQALQDLPSPVALHEATGLAPPFPAPAVPLNFSLPRMHRPRGLPSPRERLYAPPLSLILRHPPTDHFAITIYGHNYVGP